MLKTIGFCEVWTYEKNGREKVIQENGIINWSPAENRKQKYILEKFSRTKLRKTAQNRKINSA